MPSSISYDPSCYLCPGNLRAGGHRNEHYDSTYIFENDYAALNRDVPVASMDVDGTGLLRAATESGICRVLCFDPNHDRTLASMTVSAIEKVVDLWADQERELGSLSNIAYVQVFENRGAIMGASNPHPHGQIWATQHIPSEPNLELISQQEYFAEHGKVLLSAYLDQEISAGERIVATNSTWVALVPFWTTWPFELLLLTKRVIRAIHELTGEERCGLAQMLKTVTAAFNGVFDAPFPYSMGFHPAPVDHAPHPEWHLHAHFYPPLLRSATVRKFMVGFELLGSPQRDVTPESAAAVLREASAETLKADL